MKHIIVFVGVMCFATAKLSFAQNDSSEFFSGGGSPPVLVGGFEAIYNTLDSFTFPAIECKALKPRFLLRFHLRESGAVDSITVVESSGSRFVDSLTSVALCDLKFEMSERMSPQDYHIMIPVSTKRLSICRRSLWQRFVDLFN